MPRNKRFDPRPFLVCLAALLSFRLPAFGATPEAVQARLDKAVSAGRPLVVHVVVALCDNKHQGIVPVPAQLGNGQDPENNLYWGALYGLRTYLTKKAGWDPIAHLGDAPDGVLEKVLLRKTVSRGGGAATVYLVAEAWDGREIKAAIERFLSLAAGRDPEAISLKTPGAAETIPCGGAAHLVAYVGHNGLMDFSLASTPAESPAAQPRSAVVLACKSKQYFLEPLRRAGAHALLMTTGLMAPEAYTLDAAIRAWAAGEAPGRVRERAAAAYDKFQKCGLAAARRLFCHDSEPARTAVPAGSKQ